MNKKIFIANWKMSPKTQKEAETLFLMYLEAARKISGREPEIMIAVPYLFLPALIKRNKNPKISFAAQDCFWEREGAFTGEISPLMLKNLGCTHVILGHSERRRYQKETDAIINAKIKAALKERLKVVLCVGESNPPRQEGSDYLELKQQFLASLEGLSSSQARALIFAYEPVWAISSNVGAVADDPDDALSSILYLRRLLGEKYNRDLAQKARFVYGGSVNSKNVATFVVQEGIDGVLVGSASLNGSEALKIVETILSK